eukprot:353251-Chlamydomonas_euryale.AAC.1
MAGGTSSPGSPEGRRELRGPPEDQEGAGKRPGGGGNASRACSCRERECLGELRCEAAARSSPARG